MVKIEDEVYNADVPALLQSVVFGEDVKPNISQNELKEECPESSSSGHLRIHFIGMGFSPSIVDKVLAENGEEASDDILELLLSYSALQNASPGSNPLDRLFDGDNEASSYIRNNRGYQADQSFVELDLDSTEKRSYLLSIEFSEQEVDMATSELGESATLDDLANFILAARTAGVPMEEKTNEDNTEALYGVMNTSLSLLQMGFTEEEVSLAIDNIGHDAPLVQLSDFIFTWRHRGSIKIEDVPNDGGYVKSEHGYDDINCPPYHYRSSTSDSFPFDNEGADEKEFKTGFSTYGEPSSKRAKTCPTYGETASTIVNDQSEGRIGSLPRSLSSGRGGCSIINNSVKEQNDISFGIRGEVTGDIAEPPYFFYGNVAELPQNAWKTIKHFLSNIDPEFISSEQYSAVIRREGYVHNLPTKNRSASNPNAKKTIQEALPYTRQWWPEWDTRRQIHGVSSEISGAKQVCEHIRCILRDSDGSPSRPQQIEIIEFCKSYNLIWTGESRVSPLEPGHLERLLGFPYNHTNIYELDVSKRIEELMFCFQTDTLAYALSGLKGKYPNGINVLSVCSGIGGAEVALTKLGIRLKNVLSIESSEASRKILKIWWGNTKQTGQLRQLASVSSLRTQRLEYYWKEFGGFDLIFGANPGKIPEIGSSSSTTNRNRMDVILFHEYVRLVTLVRNLAKSMR